jgi:hypothetical protein
MKTGTPILDKSIYLRVGVPFILLIDLKPGRAFMWLRRQL